MTVAPFVVAPLPAAARAAQGAHHLDHRMPGWWRLVDPDTLDLFSEETCIAGQIGAHFAWPGEHPLAIYTRTLRGLDLTLMESQVYHGLLPVGPDTDAMEADNTALVDAWRALLAARVGGAR